MKINIPLDYVVGYLRYGHLEGEIDFTEEEEKEFTELLIKESKDTLTKKEEDKLEDYKYQITEFCHVVIDDYSLEDWGHPYWEDLLRRE